MKRVMFAKRLPKFRSDEAGASTILAIFWFILFVGLGGLAVDITNGYRYQTMMQATADASAHAALQDLPDENAALVTALAYADDIMPPGLYGQTLSTGDVEFGTWVPTGRVFISGAASPNAVKVTLRSTGATGNGVPINFLRIAGFYEWDVTVAAIAAHSSQACFNEGLLALGIVDIETGNAFTNHMCIHGELGVDMQEYNDFEEGVSVTMPSLDMFVHPAQVCDQNTGLCQDPLYPGDPGALNIDSMAAEIQAQLNTIPGNIDGLIGEGMPEGATQADYMPEYVNVTDYSVIEVPTTFRFRESEMDAMGIPNHGAGRIFHVVCDPTQQTDIGNYMTIDNIVIVTDCMLNNGSGTTFTNAVLASRAPAGLTYQGEPYPGIKLAADVILGDDFCETDGNGDPLPDDQQDHDGGVLIYSKSSIKTSSGTYYRGVRMYAAENITLTAANGGIEGIAVYAGGDIHLTTDSAMAAVQCVPGGLNENAVISYAIVD